MQTRREFLISTAACAFVVGGAPPWSAAASAALGPECAAEAAALHRGGPLIGDPYTAHADECGLGGRSFDAAREHAMRFRMPDGERDRFVLGLEV